MKTNFTSMNTCKKYLFVLFSSLCLFLFQSQAQKNSHELSSLYLHISSNDSIIASKFNFRHEVYRVRYFNRDKLLILVTGKMDLYSGQWRTKAKVTAIDLGKGTILYQRNLRWPSFNISKSAFFVNAGNNVQAFSTISGELLWERKHCNFTYVNDSMDFWIDTHGSLNSILTGQAIWGKRIPDYILVEDVEPIDQDNLILSASGLHWVNRKQGIVRSFSFPSSKPYTKGRSVNTALFITSILASAASGVPVGFSKNEPRDIYKISSNILISDESIYIAGRDSLYKVSLNGERIWSIALQSEKTGIQKLFIQHNLLEYINSGMSYGDTRIITTGHPEFSYFDITNGTLLYHATLPRQGEVILDCLNRDSSVNLLFHSFITTISSYPPFSISHTPIAGTQHLPAHFITDNEPRFAKDAEQTLSEVSIPYTSEFIGFTDQKKRRYFVNINSGNTEQLSDSLFRKIFTGTTTELFYNNHQLCLYRKSDKQLSCLEYTGSLVQLPDYLLISRRRSTLIISTDTIDR